MGHHTKVGVDVLMHMHVRRPSIVGSRLSQDSAGGDSAGSGEGARISMEAVLHPDRMRSRRESLAVRAGSLLAADDAAASRGGDGL